MNQYVQYTWSQMRPPYHLISSTGAVMEGRLYPIEGRWIGTIKGTEEQITAAIVLCADYDMIAISDEDAQKYITENDIPLMSERVTALEDALLSIILGG